MLGRSWIAFALASSFLAIISSTSVGAQAACAEWIGKSPAFVTLDSVKKRFASYKPKDEFETTKAFENRVAWLSAGFETIVIEKEIEDRKFLEFDADSGFLRIKSFAWDNTTGDWRSQFSAAALSGMRSPAEYGNHAIVLHEVDRKVGVAKGVTAMGVEFLYEKIERTQKGLFDKGRTISPYDEEFFLESTLDRIVVSADSARRIKGGSRTALVFRPRAPFYVEGTTSLQSARLNDPREINQIFQTAIGAIPCALLLDESGKVFRAYPTGTARLKRS